ncbi:hypothetical protein JCM8547_004565 [Rhodosporidiobolus lusitaniae]
MAKTTPAGFQQRDAVEERRRSRTPIDRDDDAALDELLKPYTFGATPTLDLTFTRQFSVGAVEEGPAGAGEPRAGAPPLAAPAGGSGFGAFFNRAPSPLPSPSGLYPHEPSSSRPHRPTSLLSRRSTASFSSSSNRHKDPSSSSAPPRPYSLPPGLAAHSPVPPPSSAGSTIRPAFSTSPSTSTALPKRRSFQLSSLNQPRAARVAYEPPIPLDVQWLLLTTPPPPRAGRASTSKAAREDVLAKQLAVRGKEKEQEKQREESRRKEGLVRRLWALRGYGDGRRSDAPRALPPTAKSEEVELTIKAPETLDLIEKTWTDGRGLAGRTGRIDSRSAADAVPRSWKDFEALYAAGQLDIEDPPFPPLCSPSHPSYTFPSRQTPSDGPAPSPFETAHFVAPLHLSPITPIRERLIAQLDLLGERFSAPGPAPTSALPPIPDPLPTSTFASPDLSASSASSTVGRRDSLIQFTSSQLSGRRDSNASTAPSSALSHGSAAIAVKARPNSAVFPSRTAAAPAHSALSSSARSVPLQASLSSGSGSAFANLSLKNHPALVGLLLRALNAPLGSPALFNPPPKAAVVTLFPAAGSSSPTLTILAGLNIPSHVSSLPLSHAIDGHTILNGERGLVVMDTKRDWRWRGNELVKDGPNVEKTGGGLGIRFYAGMPIFAPSLPSIAPFEEAAGGRIAIGTVALLDDQPQLGKWGASERAKLRSLSSQITVEVERFLNAREKATFLRRGSASSSVGGLPPSTTLGASLPPSSATTSPKPSGHAKKVSFDPEGGRRASQGYVDWNAQLAAASFAVKPAPERQGKPAALHLPVEDNSLPSPLLPSALPPLLASTSPSVIFSAACHALATNLQLSLVYLVALDLSSCPPAPSIVGTPVLSLLAAHNLPTNSNASFDPALHLRALRAPEGGLLYRSPPSNRTKDEKGKAREKRAAGSGFASGVLLPVAETDVKGWVLAGYTIDKKRRWGEEEMEEFEEVRRKLAKVVLWQDRGGWGPDGGRGETLPPVQED